MGLIQSIKFSNFALHKLVRFDLKYLNYKLKKNKVLKSIKVKESIHSYFKGFAFKGEDFSSIGKNYVLKGDLFNDDFSINFNKIQYLDDVFLDTHYKFKLNKNDIVISLVGSIGKMVIIDDEYNMLLNQNNISLQVNKELFNNKFFAYVLKREIYDLACNVYGNSGYSFLSIDDLFNLEIPNIDLKIQNEVIEKVESLEKEIVDLKVQKKEYLEIINDVFSNEFNINLKEVKKLTNIKKINLKFKNIILKNDSIRTSFKWQKLETIQSYMYQDLKCIEKLSNFIISTKNGWSPKSSEVEEGTPILGQEHILKNGKISLSASKYTVLTRNNIEDFYIKKNDFFVSRGNTVELVALAGIVTDDIEDNILYPDLYIKIEFNEEYINKQYMAYLFNSFFGRIYFKHVAKGKNQTMVKVSSKELYDFYVPLPDKTIQQEIVDKIQTQIDSQKDIDKQIEDKQGEISKIIEDCIQTSGDTNG